MKIKLYDYQEIAYQKVIQALNSAGIALMVMATGLGKTIVSALIARFFLSSGSGKRILFLSHDNGILEQSYLKYKLILGNEYSYARFFGKKKNWNADKHDIVFATFQSKPHKFFKADHFDFIIVDESHHSKADTYFSTLNYFTPVWKLGMTATPDREDERDIRSIFGKEVVTYDLSEAMANGWLTPVEYKILSDGMDLAMLEEICQEVLVENVRISESQLNERIFIRTRSDEQCKQILDYTKNGLKAIVFCANITHLEHIMELLPNSVAVHSGRTDDENDEAEIMYRTGKASHILVVDKYNEGKDLPDTDVLVFLRTTDSYRIWVQQLGRGLRLFPGKDKVIILDFVANIERVKNVHSFAMQVKEYGGGGINQEFKLDTPLHLEGKNFSFDFSSELVNLMSVFEKVSLNCYANWKEASNAAINLGITKQEEYRAYYKQDIRLPSAPEQVYSDFPGYKVFLGGVSKDYYLTWQEASIASIKLGIKTQDQYHKDYMNDPRLPSQINTFYPNFPGSKVFFGGVEKDYYLTLKEAQEAAKKLGIKTYKEYSKRYKEDPKLPSVPGRFYSDYVSFDLFIGSDYYSTWQEASDSVKKLNICTRADYQRKQFYKKDLRLHSNPDMYYKDFPDWQNFLGKE
ncbi:MAG: DEAD/DEAH box helicase family protein [Candidatus Nomurabacteria bacterium]|nr:DEAD/DEAH box helicase family protein [Candidatus Nomurabacteria bacterium]